MGSLLINKLLVAASYAMDTGPTETMAIYAQPDR